jgi:hypothetical protein
MNNDENSAKCLAALPVDFIDALPSERLEPVSSMVMRLARSGVSAAPGKTNNF